MIKRLLKVIILLLTAVLLGHWYTIDHIRQWIFDLQHDNQPVRDWETLEKLLGHFEKVSYQKLDVHHLRQTDSDLPKYEKMLRSAVYLKVPHAALQQRIVGRYRLKDFVSHDGSYRQAIYGVESHIFWLIDPKVLKKFLSLQQEMEKQGLDPQAFQIICAHRHPRYNARINGVSNSRHVLGQAIDLMVKDVNQDGRYTDADKDMVLKLLEEKIIRDMGGIGRYPGTRVVHFDTRGHRARWNKQ